MTDLTSQKRLESAPIVAPAADTQAVVLATDADGRQIVAKTTLPATPLTAEQLLNELRTFVQSAAAGNYSSGQRVLTRDAAGNFVETTLPAIPAAAAPPLTDDEFRDKILNYIDEIATSLVAAPDRTLILGRALEIVRGYLTYPQIAALIAAHLSPDASPAITALSNAFSEIESTEKVWRRQNPFPDNNSKMLFGTLIGEAAFDKTAPNEITTGHDISVPADLDDARYRLYYENGASPVNFQFAGRRSQFGGTPLNIYGPALAEFPQSLTFMFDYILPTRQLNAGENIPLLQVADKHPAIGLSAENGAYISKAEFVPGATINTTVSKLFLPLNVAAPTYHIAVSAADAAAGGVAFDEFFWYVQNALPQNASIRINLTAYPDTSGAQTVTHIAAIADWDADQELVSNLNLQFSVGDDGVRPPSMQLRVRYIADHNGSHAIHISTVGAVQTVTPYALSVGYEFTRSVERPSETEYAIIPIRAADDHINGLFNAALDPELQLNTGITIIAQFIVGTDGYVHVRVLVNGIAENNGNFINTQRTSANFGLPELARNAAGGGIFLGDELTRISRVYGIASDKALTIAQMQEIYRHRATPGLNYYALEAPEPTWRLDGQLQVKNKAGEFFSVAPGGIDFIQNSDGTNKNFLADNPITDTSLLTRTRTIPALENAKRVYVGFTDGADLSFSARCGAIIDDRFIHISADNVYCVVGGVGTSKGQRYYFSFPRPNQIKFDTFINAGNPIMSTLYIT